MWRSRGFRLAHCDCMRRVAKVAIGLELLLGIGAVGGGIALMAGPNGEILPLPVSALGGSPFTSYFVPGAILCFVLGVGHCVRPRSPGGSTGLRHS